jgi:hypothetical protein
MPSQNNRIRLNQIFHQISKVLVKLQMVSKKKLTFELQSEKRKKSNPLRLSIRYNNFNRWSLTKVYQFISSMIEYK